MQPYTINRGIPLPQKKRGRPSIYPLHELQVGESFFAPKPRKTVYATVALFAKKHGKAFVLDEWEEDGVLGTRVWRTK